MLKGGVKKLSNIDKYRKEYVGKVYDDKGYYNKVLSKHMFVTNTLIKRSFIIQNSIFFDERLFYLEDAPYWIDLLSNHPLCMYTGIRSYVYRWRRPNSLCEITTSDKKIYSQIYAAAWIADKTAVIDGARELASDLVVSAIFMIYIYGDDKNSLFGAIVENFSKLYSTKNQEYRIISTIYNISPRLIFCLLLNAYRLKRLCVHYT